MLFCRRKKKKEEPSEDPETIRLEKNDLLAMLISAYYVFIPVAILAIGAILLVVFLLFRIT